jgi:hypothetical protein
MGLLIHAHIEVTGDSGALQRFRERLVGLLAEEEREGEIQEQIGANRLRYDLKVSGGIPFPPFIAASQALPELRISVEWFSPAEAARGSAVIQAGKLLEHTEGPTGGMPLVDDEPLYVRVEAGGRLGLAFALLSLSPQAHLGYTVTADRDAFFRLTRQGETARLQATVGTEPQWGKAWTIDLQQRRCQPEALDPPLSIEEQEHQALLALADGFVARWIWFRDAPEEETVLERDRYARLGYPVREANVKSAKLRLLTAQGNGVQVADTLGPGLEWIEEVLTQCWLENESAPGR